MQQAPRFDIYAFIHKALRFQMGHVLFELGRMDTRDQEDVAAKLRDLRELLAACSTHLELENQFIHSAMNARQPASAIAAAADHIEHVHALADLEELAFRLEAAKREQRSGLMRHLYRELAKFVAENFAHMALEERDNNAVLWAHYSDAELIALSDALVASIGTARTAQSMRWLLPALCPEERTKLLSKARLRMPSEAFEKLLESLRPLLAASDRRKLEFELEISAERISATPMGFA